ncbi:EnvZ/OmpR regulon moderator MzrA [Erwinia sp. E_sp_B04_7]|uniref:EnvZ/OmpR regulon moderator MzrA n=1 Tax=unclassified Erwinia TaxID=2622719 RepID=UPI0030CFDD0A
MSALLKKYYSTRMLCILLVCLSALMMVAFLPGIFRNETALQIRVSRQGTSLPDGFYVYQRLNAEGIRIKSITPDNDSLVIRFDTQEQSTAAEKVLHQLLPYGFDIGQMDPSGSSQLMNRLTLRKQSVG